MTPIEEHTAGPRSWSMPVIPDDVTRVSAREGHFIAERVPDAPAYWVVRSVPTGKTYPYMTTNMLLHDFGPLTEAS